MTALQNPTFAQMTAALEHAATTEGGGKPKSGKNKKGDFDESKVKRDGEGQFSKKDGKGNKMDELADSAWLKDLEVVQVNLLDKVAPEMEKIYFDTLKKHGISSDTAEDDIPKKVMGEINDASLSRLNLEAAQSSGPGVSPSGKHRVTFTLSDKGELNVSATSRYGSVPDREVYRSSVATARTIRQIRRGAAENSSSGIDRPMFNPDAQLDTSRVIDVPANSKTGTSEPPKSVLDKFKDLFHSDLAVADILGIYEIESEVPTLDEMRHFLEINEALAHYGIKGMKWGIRRSDRELASLHNEEGERVGGIHASTRKEANQLKSMKAGQAVVINSEDGPRAVVKLKDGTFKQVHISADAQNAVRTMNKEQVEMSTREIKEAASRAKAIEDYNKYFGDKDSEKPNAELQAAVDRLQLEQKYSQAYSQLNPSRIERTSSFISKAAPIYDTYAKIDKASGGQMTTGLKEIVDMMRGTVATPAASSGKVKTNYGPGSNNASISVKSKGPTKVRTIKRKGATP